MLKKCLSVIISAILVFSFVLTASSGYIRLDGPMYDTSILYVALKHEYSDMWKKWYPADFDADVVLSVEDVNCADPVTKDLSGYNMDVYCKCLKLTLNTDAGYEPDEFLAKILRLPFVSEAEYKIVGIVGTLDSEKSTETIRNEARDFSATEILVVIKHEYSEMFKDWYPADFDADMVESVKDISRANPDDTELDGYNMDNYHQILVLTLKEPSKENVLLLVDKLQSNPLLECAEPNYISDVQLEQPSDVIDTDGIMRGDVTADGKITAADARLVLRYSARLETYTSRQGVLADYDMNGSITAADARTILRIAAQLE